MFKFSFFSKDLIFLSQSFFYMLQNYCNHFSKVPNHKKPQELFSSWQASKTWVEWAMVWTMDQKVPREQPLKQLETPSVIPLCIHLRQHVAVNIPSNKSLGKLVCGHLESWRNRTSRIQLLEHCLPSPQAEPIMEPLDSHFFCILSILPWNCACAHVHNPLPSTVYPTGLVHLIKKSTHLCYVIWCSFSPMGLCYYQRIEVTLLQNIFSLFVRDNFFLLLNVN